MSLTVVFSLVAFLAGGDSFAVQERARERVPVDQISFVLREGANFCFVELDATTDVSVIVDFETTRGTGNFSVRKSAEEVEYSLADPVKHIERWQEAGVSMTQFALKGRSGGDSYEGTLTVLKRAGVSDGIVLKISRNGAPLNYECASDFSEEELSK